MKKAFESTNQVRMIDQAFSKFSEIEILTPKSMNFIRGADGGEVIWVPPPPKP